MELIFLFSAVVLGFAATAQAAVQARFERLVKMTEDGTLIHAGRSMSDAPVGVVMFEAATDEEAKRVAEMDPAVVKGVMTAEVFPYEVLLARTSESAL